MNKTKLFNFAYKISHLAIGEILSRLSSFILFAFIGRTLGTEGLGLVSLAQTFNQYGMIGSDMGTKLIGARLVAKDINQTRELIPRIEKKRIVLSIISFSLIFIYANFGPIPKNGKYFIISYSLALFPYALSLDWVIWGLGKLWFLGLWRAIIGVFFLVLSIVGLYISHLNIFSISAAYGISLGIGSCLLWYYWFAKLKPLLPKINKLENRLIDIETNWMQIFLLGLASFLNQMFQNLDTLLLAAFSNVKEVGLYNSAYKILFVTFGGFYLLTQAAYPTLAKIKTIQNAQKSILKFVFLATLGGGIFTICFENLSNNILKFIYGNNLLGATNILKILSLSIPLEFGVAIMGTTLTGIGRNKELLYVTGISACFNLFLNLFMIPKYGAIGAAWTTIASYLLLYLILILIFTTPFFRNLKIRS